VDTWQPTEIVEQVEIGTLEVHSWIATCTAARRRLQPARGGSLRANLEHGVGVGLIHATS
jgi:hypothetical protein